MKPAIRSGQTAAVSDAPSPVDTPRGDSCHLTQVPVATYSRLTQGRSTASVSARLPLDGRSRSCLGADKETLPSARSAQPTNVANTAAVSDAGSLMDTPRTAPLIRGRALVSQQMPAAHYLMEKVIFVHNSQQEVTCADSSGLADSGDVTATNWEKGLGRETLGPSSDWVVDVELCRKPHRVHLGRTLSSSVLEVTSKGNTPLLPEVPCVGQTNNICDKENWGREPGMVAMSGHSTPAFGGVPNSSDIFAKPDKSFGVLGDASSLVKRLSDWNSNLDPIEVERSFPSPDRLCLDNSEEVKLSSQEIEALESTLELSFVFTDLEVSEVTGCIPETPERPRKPEAVAVDTENNLQAELFAVRGEIAALEKAAEDSMTSSSGTGAVTSLQAELELAHCELEETRQKLAAREAVRLAKREACHELGEALRQEIADTRQELEALRQHQASADLMSATAQWEAAQQDAIESQRRAAAEERSDGRREAVLSELAAARAELENARSFAHAEAASREASEQLCLVLQEELINARNEMGAALMKRPSQTQWMDQRSFALKAELASAHSELEQARMADSPCSGDIFAGGGLCLQRGVQRTGWKAPLRQ